jgi:ribose/xylose/arabinose/galactoside ABC-type transport system permease subunit
MFLFLSFTLPRFLTLVNLTNLVRQLSITLVVAAGVTVVMIGGEIDISVGSIVTLSAIICGMGINRYGVGIGMLSGVAAGLTIGALNGLFVAVFKTPSFITTLSTMLIARSLSYVISRGQVISNFPQGFRGLSQSEFLGIPVLMIYVILVYLLTNWYMLRTRFGKYVYATGSNEISAGLCGIKTTGVKFTTFIISGLYSGFAGILLLSRIMAVQADTARNMELEVFASVIVGGTALYGGRGNVLMTIVGVFIIGMIRNAVNLSRIDMFWNDLLTGVIILVALLVAVGWNRFRRISGEMLGASE